MVVILAIFDEKIGPAKLFSIPAKVDEEIMSRILLLMNQGLSEDEMHVNDLTFIGMKSFTMHVMVPSKWARGGYNFMQVTVLTRIEDAPVKKVETGLETFKKKISGNENVYKGFYSFNSRRGDKLDPAPREEEIKASRRFLEDACTSLFHEVATGLPSTYGCISSIESVIAGRFISAGWFAMEIENVSVTRNASKFFIVHRVDSDGAISIKIMPIKRRVLKVKVKMKQLEANQIMQIAKAINLPLLSTSGMCRETNKDCFYEGYFEHDKDFPGIKVMIEKNVASLPFVENVDITVVDDV